MLFVLKDILEPELDILITAGEHSDPRPPRPFGHVNVLTGPINRGLATEKTSKVLNSEYLIDVPNPVTNTDYLMRVNGIPHRIQPTTTDVEDLRDSFIASINDDAEPVSAASTLPNQFRVAETTPGGIVLLSTRLPLGGVVSPSSIEHCATIHSSRSRMTLDFQIFSKSTKVTVGAQQLMTMVEMALDLDRSQEKMEDNRMVFRVANAPTNLTGISSGGAANEGRSNIDLLVDITSMYAEVTTNVIESVEAELTIGENTIPINAEL